MIIREAIVSLYGAWRLARLDPRGIELFDRSEAGAVRSFAAAVPVLPLYVLAALMLAPRGPTTHPLRWLSVQAIAYVLSWVAYPVAAESLTRVMGCRQRFAGYLSAYNWSMVLQNAALLPLTLLTILQVLPDDIMQFLWLAAIAVVMGWLWFIARTALAIGGLAAAGLVLADQLISMLIDNLATRLS